MLMKLEELDMYQMSMEIGEIIWESVDRFSYFAKDTLGKQVVRSADSIAANIAEGEGAFYSGVRSSSIICFENNPQ